MYHNTKRGRLSQQVKPIAIASLFLSLQEYDGDDYNILLRRVQLEDYNSKGNKEDEMENHKVVIDNRERTTITEIVEIDSFDEGEVRATLKRGALIIKGDKLSIENLDVKEGIVAINGMVNSIMYVKVKQKNEKSILDKLMK